MIEAELIIRSYILSPLNYRNAVIRLGRKRERAHESSQFQLCWWPGVCLESHRKTVSLEAGDGDGDIGPFSALVSGAMCLSWYMY